VQAWKQYPVLGRSLTPTALLPYIALQLVLRRGGTDVINWDQHAGHFVHTYRSQPDRRANLLCRPQGRNEGGLWSEAAIAGVVAGSGECSTNVKWSYLPLVLRRH